MAREVVIRYLTGEKAGREETFRDFPVVVGRDPACHLAFHPQVDTKVSAKHAEIRLGDNGAILIHDLESKNGVLVDGDLVTGSRELPRKSTVEVGKGGPRVELLLVEGGSGISFAEVRRSTGVLKRGPRDPLVSTDDSLQAFREEALNFKGKKPKPVMDVRSLTIVFGVVVALASLLAYFLLK